MGLPLPLAVGLEWGGEGEGTWKRMKGWRETKEAKKEHVRGSESSGGRGTPYYRYIHTGFSVDNNRDTIEALNSFRCDCFVRQWLLKAAMN